MGFSFNDIPNGILTPFVTFEFDSSKAGTGTALKSYKALVVGQRLAAGTVAELVPTLVTSAEDARVFFGAGSMLAQMAELWFAANRFTEVTFVALDDDGGGAQATGTITVTASSAQAGTLYLWIGGRLLKVGVSANDTATAIGDAIVAAITAEPMLAVTAVNAAGTVTLTAKHAGTLGNSIDVRVNYAAGQFTPSGVTVAIVAMSGGTGDPDASAIWAVIGEEQYDWIAWPYNDATNLSALDTELADRWGPLRQIEGFAFTAARDTHANLVTLGGGHNSKHYSILGAAATLQPTWEWAASYAAVGAFYLSADPARPIQTLELVDLLAPAIADRFTQSEQQILLGNGIATVNSTAEGKVRIQRAITTYQTNAVGAADTAFLDVNTPATLAYLRYDFRTLFATKYARHKLGQDGKRYAQGQAIMTPSLGRSEAIARFILWEERALVEGLDQFKADLQVVIDDQDPNRLNFLLPTNLVNQLRVVAGKIEFRL